MLNKLDVRRIESKIFDDTKATGVKKIRLRTAHSFSVSERNILGTTNNEAKYQKFNAKFMNKAAPRLVRVENVFSQLKIILVHMRNQLF